MQEGAVRLRTRWTTIAGLLLILLLALYLRVDGVGQRSIWFDEAATWRVATAQTIGEFLNRIRLLENTPPAHYVIEWLWIRLFGASEASLRMPSVFAGVTSVYLIYRLMTLLVGRREGLVAALLLACSPFQIMYSGEARSYELLVCAALMSCVNLAHLRREPTLRRSFWYVLTTSLLLYTHLYSVFVVAAQNIAMLVDFASPSRSTNQLTLWRWIKIQAVTAATMLPFLPVILFWIRRQTMGFWIPRPTWDDVTAAYLDYAGTPLLLCLFVALAVIGVVRHRRRLTLLLALLVIPVLVPVILSMLRTPMFVSRYGIVSGAALIALAAVGVAAFRTSMVIVPLSLLLAGLSLTTTSPPATEDWRQAAQYVERYAQPGDCVLINKRYSTFAFNFYGDIPGVQVKGFWGGHVTLGLPLPPKVHAWLILNHPDVAMREIVDAGNWRILSQKAFREIVVLELADGQTEKLPPELDLERLTAGRPTRER